jgi:hypothetical protein
VHVIVFLLDTFFDVSHLRPATLTTNLTFTPALCMFVLSNVSWLRTTISNTVPPAHLPPVGANDSILTGAHWSPTNLTDSSNAEYVSSGYFRLSQYWNGGVVLPHQMQ